MICRGWVMSERCPESSSIVLAFMRLARKRSSSGLVVRSPSGCEDLPAWKRLLAHLAFHDPRRSLAAARVRSLREAYGMPAARTGSRSVSPT